MKPTRKEGEPFSVYMARLNAYFESNPPAAPIENQRPDLIRSDLKTKQDQIRSDVRPLEKEEALELARSWGLHDGNFKTAINRMGLPWLIQQINFVATYQKATHKGKLLSVILSRNQI